MSEKFNLEIISKIISKSDKQVTIPAYEGLMTILKDHISLVTFLRPGLIEVEIEDKIEKFYVEEGTVEFFNNKLLILSTSALHVEKLAKDSIEKMLEESKTLLQNSEIKDKDRYILSYKIGTINKIN